MFSYIFQRFFFLNSVDDSYIIYQVSSCWHVWTVLKRVLQLALKKVVPRSSLCAKNLI